MTSLTLPDAAAGHAELRRFLDSLPAVDADDVARRARELASAAPPSALEGVLAAEVAIALTDLTTLEATDTPARVRNLAVTAVRPDPDDPSCPPVAALCVFSDLTADAADALRDSGVRVAAVAGAFPHGRAPLPVRVADVEAAVAAGADEIDLVLDRGAFLEERYADLLTQLRALRSAAAPAHLKVILETGDLGSPSAVRGATLLALLAGADMVKTSTGKVPAGATLPDVLVMVEAVQAYERATGRAAGVKASGGVRTTADALGYLMLVAAVGGESWLTPDRFRFGASSLLKALVGARRASAWAPGPSAP